MRTARPRIPAAPARRRRSTRAAALTAALSLVTAGAVTAVVAPAAQAAVACEVDYTIVNEWNGGYQADVEIINVGDPVSDWTLTWQFSSGQSINQAWNADVTQSGNQITAGDVGWNGSLGTGQSTSWGFIGSGQPSPLPSSFTLNGVACNGEPGPDPTTPEPDPTVTVPDPDPTTPDPDPTTPDPDPTTPPPSSGEEFNGADCDVSGNGPGSNSQLPDPFLGLDGSRITQKSQWECRRAEIKKLAENSMYGPKPAPPSGVSGSVSSSNISVNVGGASFSASVQLPSGGSAPYPAVIVYGGFGADTQTILNEGVAVISYDPFQVGQEGTGRANKSGAFYTATGSNSTGLLVAWGWGVSRIIDVIEQDGGQILDTDSFGVTGCSRYGKGAFIAGAFDQRIDLTMPIESGGGGVPIMRGLAQEAGAQGPGSSYGEQPWLGDAFGNYTNNTSGLPVDTHEVIGMIAPRGLFVMENPHVDWLGAESGSVAAKAGREIYRALGAESNISYHSSVSDGTHCATRGEWRQPMAQSLQAFLHDSGSGPGVFSVASSNNGNLDQWRSWSTPSLG